MFLGDISADIFTEISADEKTSTTESTTTTINIENPSLGLEPAQDHPTSHFRPSEPEAPSTSTSTQRADVKIVKPKYGEFDPPLLDAQDADIEEKERIVRNNAANQGYVFFLTLLLIYEHKEAREHYFVNTKHNSTYPIDRDFLLF